MFNSTRSLIHQVNAIYEFRPRLCLCFYPSTFIPSNLVLFKSITSRNSRSLSTIFLHVSCSILISHQDHSLPTQNAFFNSPSWRSRLISFLTKYHLQQHNLCCTSKSFPNITSISNNLLGQGWSCMACLLQCW